MTRAYCTAGRYQSAPLVTCPLCAKDVHLRLDGTMRQHGPRARRCKGSTWTVRSALIMAGRIDDTYGAADRAALNALANAHTLPIGRN